MSFQLVKSLLDMPALVVQRRNFECWRLDRSAHRARHGLQSDPKRWIGVTAPP
jgi:hypothetical protein